MAEGNALPYPGFTSCGAISSRLRVFTIDNARISALEDVFKYGGRLAGGQRAQPSETKGKEAADV